MRQTIDLGGETQKLEADINQFAGSQTANRLVLWVGRFAVVDVFDTNKYANSPQDRFPQLVDGQCRNLRLRRRTAGPIPMAAQPNGIRAASRYVPASSTCPQTPTGGTAPNGLNLDPTFSQFQLVGEIEERHELWGQPGKIKVTGFLSRGHAGLFADAIALRAQPSACRPIPGLVRNHYNSRTGISVNLEQQITETLGVFAQRRLG